MKSEEVIPPQVGASPSPDSARVRMFVVAALALVAAFSVPLWHLVRYAVAKNLHSLHSYSVLIPFVSAYLWRIRNDRIAVVLRSSPAAATLAALVGAFAFVSYSIWGRTGRIPPIDALSLSTFSFLCFLLALALGTLGWPFLRSRLFAVCFLIFMVPLPVAATEALSIGLQRASAEVSDVTLRLTGMPVYREGLLFQLPGLSIVVAEECSGIRSTLVLFITSLIASYMFLRTGWKRALLAFAVFPLGVLRNALRITVISWLTVNVDPEVIHGPLHHRGGPIFFILSLVPFFALLWVLRRSERRERESRAL